MDSCHQDSACSSNPFRKLDEAAPEDRDTHRRWARAVLAFYSCLFVLGAIAIEIKHTTASTQGLVAQAASQTTVGLAHSMQRKQ